MFFTTITFKKLLILFIIISAISYANSKTLNDVSIGSESVRDNHIPIEPYYGYSYSQSIYLNSEINTSGSINSISWYLDGSSLSNSNNWDIYLGLTSKTKFENLSDWIPDSSLSLVWSGTFQSPTGPGWIEFRITDFNFDMEKNLVIAIDENAPGYNSDKDDFFSSSVSENRSIYFISDNTNPNPSSLPVSNGILPYIPNIVLGFSSTNLTNKIISSDLEYGDSFGEAVAIDKNFAVVSAVAKNNNSGAVYTFKRDGENWNQDAKLIPLDAEDNIYFGKSVSIYNNLLVVGAPQKGSSGCAYIFQNINDQWTETTKLIPSDSLVCDNFGNSVSIDGDYIIVGAASTQSTTATPAAYIFHKLNGTWVQEAKFVSPDSGTAYDNFGRSVDISNDFAVIGNPGKNIHDGVVYVYRNQNNNWTMYDELSNGLPDSLGWSVSISGENIIAGTLQFGFVGRYPGESYIFHFNGVEWINEQKLVSSDAHSNDTFGYTNAIFGTFALVGAIYGDSDVTGEDVGASYLYFYNGDSWVQREKITAIDGKRESWFGNAVALSENYCLIGSKYLDGSGAAYLYKYSSGPSSISITPGNIPQTVTLYNNFPNPFNAETKISFDVHKQSGLKDSNLSIYNILGQHIQTLASGPITNGIHEFTWNAQYQSSGVYYLRLSDGKQVQCKKMILLK